MLDHCAAGNFGVESHDDHKNDERAERTIIKEVAELLLLLPLTPDKRKTGRGMTQVTLLNVIVILITHFYADTKKKNDGTVQLVSA